MENTSRPNWFLNLCDFYFRTKILRWKIPLLASFKLTFRCNLSCNACPFHQRATDTTAHISWNTAVRALNNLKKSGCRIVVFEGGEPLLWKDGPHDSNELIRYAKQHFLRVAATTNGTLPLNAPVDVLWVSLDGLQQTHDRLRSNSFDRIWQNLAASTHPNLLVHFTLHRENRQELEPLLKKLREVPAVRGMTVQLFYPYGQGEEPLALSKPERRAALEKVIELKKQGYPVFNSTNRLRAMIENRWKCRDDILINVDPDGIITTGCYVKNRGEIRCSECGFTPVAEASGALNLLPGSILTGWKIYLKQ